MNQAAQYAATATCGIPKAQASKPASRIVPFDQVVTFELTGKRDNVLSKITNISAEGPFVAVAMSYSFRPEASVIFGLPDVEGPGEIENSIITALFSGFERALQRRQVERTKIVVLQEQLLRAGIQLNPGVADVVFSQRARNSVSFLAALNNLGIYDELFQAVTFQEGDVHFLYNITDNANSREFQSEPVHNIAGLGIANGDRPFRAFPQPLMFAPRSTIRIQITEISGIGRLYFVLQGYKILGSGNQGQA